MKDKILIPLVILLEIILFPHSSYSQEAREIRRFQVKEAMQAVAVDKNYFYVINSSTITKHNKNNGIQVVKWDGKSDGIKHLNSGTVRKGKLYCATSNYPDSPMASSIEIFDANTLKHIENHSFGIFSGSATWIDQKGGYWYVGFAHYSGKGSSEGKDNRWTAIVKFSKQWQQVESWVFPESIIEAFSPSSNSGAAWGKDGKLYCTGHDKAEIYVMEIPQTGFTLRHVKTIKTSVHGQGIAFDHSVKNNMLLYGISRKDNLVIVSEIK
ncbi:MAG: hypothetical protein LLG13_13150 [Bacteroidales bacterium]|nr:hypothetical protein [Bacteroidales bacterium]